MGQLPDGEANEMEKMVFCLVKKRSSFSFFCWCETFCKQSLASKTWLLVAEGPPLQRCSR